MDKQQPAKPRLAFTRGQASSSGATARKHVPVEDALARMAGKMGERRRASSASRRPDDEDDGVPA
jgi:hypothetical protein